jgi:hypothetical protein
VVCRRIFASSNEQILTKQQNIHKQTKTNKMKKLFAIASVLFASYAANAQTAATASASQTTKLSLTDAVEIVFTGSGSATGSLVTLPFTTVDNYTNGVESDAQDLKIRSNKDFSVTVKSNATNFTYSGSTTPAPAMPVSGVLNLMVSANGTGGSIAAPFSAYSSLTSSNQSLISAGTRGGNQTFSVKYKGTPGFSYPAGDYSVNIVYTVTQQ